MAPIPDTSDAAAVMAGLPVLPAFGQIADPSCYAPLPGDWFLGVADVVGSTEAVEAGRYKAVNMAGAAVIAGLSNAVGQAPFPFVFGGDGASVAVPPGWEAVTRRTLAETARLAAEAFGLTLRVALLPVAAVREAGLDIRVARFAVSPDLDQTMFSGGGLAWAEAAMKEGRFAVSAAPPGSRPDLSGLSCRFAPLPTRRGVILSVLVRQGGADGARYRAVVGRLLDLVERSPDRARPVPAGGPPLLWPPDGLGLEAAATLPAGEPAWLHRLRVRAHNLLVVATIRFRLPLGRFKPVAYMAQLVANTDYRKYDDGLRLTLDCTPALADRIEAVLADAQRDGIVRFGLHRQNTALMTCFTHSALRPDHIHFVDGADGGYAAAAAHLKRRSGDGA